jgi:AraC-like DNA-binding protein
MMFRIKNMTAGFTDTAIISNPTVSAGLPKAFLDFAVSKGANRQTLLERSQICTDELIEQDNRIPLAKYMELIKSGIELCRDPALSLLFGEKVRLQDISIVGLIGETSETTGDAYHQLNRYGRLMLDENNGKVSDLLQLVFEKGNVWLKHNSPIYTENPLLTESAFARSICGGREIFGPDHVFTTRYPKEIHFTHPEPSYRAEYDRIFGVPLIFGSKMNALLMDEEFLSIKLPRSNRYVFGVLSQHATDLLKSLENSKTTRGRVESLLLPILHTGDTRIELIAKKLGCSRQTLFRKLKAEDTTFEKILDELRHKLALHYLSEKKVSVNETAYLIGFSEPAAFSRAFKRWTGFSPGTIGKS